MVNGQKRAHEKEKEYKYGLMVANMRGIGKMIKQMVMVD